MALIEQLENVRNDEPGNREIFSQLDAALRLHIREEDEIYYPALAEHDEFSDIMEENIPEHEMVKENLAQMAELSPASDIFQSVLAETKAALEMHMENEENDLFPRSIEVLGRDRINELGNQIDQMKGDMEMTQSARM